MDRTGVENADGWPTAEGSGVYIVQAAMVVMKVSRGARSASGAGAGAGAGSEDGEVGIRQSGRRAGNRCRSVTRISTPMGCMGLCSPWLCDRQIRCQKDGIDMLVRVKSMLKPGVRAESRCAGGQWWFRLTLNLRSL